MAINVSDPSNREAEMAGMSGLWAATPEQPQTAGPSLSTFVGDNIYGTTTPEPSSAPPADSVYVNSGDGATGPYSSPGPAPSSPSGNGSGGLGAGAGGDVGIPGDSGTPGGGGTPTAGGGGTPNGGGLPGIGGGGIPGTGGGGTPVAAGGDSPGIGGLLDPLPGLGGIGNTVGNVIADASHLVGDVLNLPGAILSGNIGEGVSHVVSDVGDIVGTVGETVGGLLGGGDVLAPVTNLVDDVATGLKDLPLLNVVGGENGGTLLGSVLNLGGSSTGNAIDLGVGPTSDHGLNLGLLTDSGTDQTIGIHALDVGPNGPQIINADLLGGDGGIDLPILDGLGLPNLLEGVNLPDLPVVGDILGGGDGGILGGVLGGLGGILGGVTDGPLAILNGGNTGDGTGLTLGDLNGSSSGHFINADIGPASDDGLGLGVLTGAITGDHTVDVGVIDVGPDGPELLDAGLLNGDGIGGLLNTGGLLDTGNLLDVGGLLDTGNLLDVGNLLNTGGLLDVGNLLNTGDLLDTGNLLGGVLDTGNLLGGILDTGGDLISINGGNNAGDGGILGGGLLNLTGSSSGHLVNADVGPSGSGGTSLDLLSAPNAADHGADIQIGDVGPDGPQIADLGLLNDVGSLLSIPGLNGAGTDALAGLTGNLLGGLTGGESASPLAGLPMVGDLGGALDVLPGLLGGEHGLLDLNGHHVI